MTRLAAFFLFAAWAAAQTPAPRASFHIKYVAADAVYLDGGRNAGLAEKMKLTVRRGADDLAELRVLSVADTSAVCDIASAAGALRPGDIAYLSAEDLQTIQIVRANGITHRYPQVITFNEGDPLDEEVRESMPHPPSPEVNRIRGRIGVEYNSFNDRGGAGLHSYQSGLVLQTDATRIGGTYWKLSGYTRLRLTRTNSPQDSLSDLMNRTYHMVLSYDNPNSAWTAGFGRFYLPWAPSLSTIDGGYLGRKLSSRLTAGLFMGSTPDPTSWNYNPARKLAGSFLNYEGGSYDALHYSSTAGAAFSWLDWHPERQFLFFENTFSFKRAFSVYHDLETDQTSRTRETPGTGPGLARSFLTLRVQPVSFLSFDINHNYFRDFPTFDPRLIGLGLLDRFLFQGVSAGARIELPRRFTFYSNFGRSSRSGDAKHSLNEMFGLTKGDLFGTGVRADFRYTRFDSSFGRGVYRALSLSRSLRENLRFDLEAGGQSFGSAYSAASSARFLNGSVQWSFRSDYYLGGGVTFYRGRTQNYNQTYINLGYRFGNRHGL